MWPKGRFRFICRNSYHLYNITISSVSRLFIFYNCMFHCVGFCPTILIITSVCSIAFTMNVYFYECIYEHLTGACSIRSGTWMGPGRWLSVGRCSRQDLHCPQNKKVCMERHDQKKRRGSKSSSKFCLIVKNVAADLEGKKREREWSENMLIDRV